MTGPGLRRRLTAAEAALLFEYQVAERAAKKAQAKILDDAGVLAKMTRWAALDRNWKRRGLIGGARL